MLEATGFIGCNSASVNIVWLLRQLTMLPYNAPERLTYILST